MYVKSLGVENSNWNSILEEYLAIIETKTKCITMYKNNSGFSA